MPGFKRSSSSSSGSKGKFAAKNNKKKGKGRFRKPELPKPCRFTRDEVFEIDYRDVEVLRRHVSSQGKINPRKRNNITAGYQRQLTTAIKRARFLALLPTVGQ